MNSSNAPEEKKVEDKPSDEQSDDALDEALEDFEKPNKLNLTADEKDDDDKLDPETEKEFQDFMKNLTNNPGGNGDEAMNQLGNLLNELMGGMGGMAGATQNPGNPEESGNDKDMMKKVFEDMMKNVNDGDFDSVAQNLLKEFMDKEILYEPLQEAKKNYDEYLKANADKIKEEDMKNYKGQYESIEKLIKICDTDANNKEEMIKTFEQMHEFGMPPEGILNPLQKINPGLAGGPTNMNDPGCNIF